ncbi:TetR family transcriptional regulator [Saccharomonospora xinjiangensis]|uniref:TetR/AcrR family transcriptional regulator n=1 Tax=Saccharomonospora xinjiangensis TaxID=75294 RepID=UPI00106F3443|nr:TetR family transcriptional regulator [Saccharomonospora xinjiangensis]QBQ59411.1 HTH-type transcriptional repressor AcnR [Saccharomonospora xinjiangensis]
MGNREALLDGARKCLLEKGYGRTTVRDIAAAAGVSMAAIGYHFGSKEALLNAALVELNGAELGCEIEHALAAADPQQDPIDRFATALDSIAETFSRHRHLLAASMEGFAQAERNPEVRSLLAEGHRRAIAALTELLSNIEPEHAAEVAALYYTTLTGLMSQWLVDPDNAPKGATLARAVRALTR